MEALCSPQRLSLTLRPLICTRYSSNPSISPGEVINGPRMRILGKTCSREAQNQCILSAHQLHCCPYKRPVRCCVVEGFQDQNMVFLHHRAQTCRSQARKMLLGGCTSGFLWLPQVLNTCVSEPLQCGGLSPAVNHMKLWRN